MSEKEHKSKLLPAVLAGTAGLGALYAGHKAFKHIGELRRSVNRLTFGENIRRADAVGKLVGIGGLAALAAAKPAIAKIKSGLKNRRINKVRERISGNKVPDIKDLRFVKEHKDSLRPEALREQRNTEILKATGEKVRPKRGPSRTRPTGKVLSFEEARKKKLADMDKLSSAEGMHNFWSGFQKRGSGLSTAAELGGLGILAVPSIQDLRDKPMGNKTKAALEVAGLGTLAAPYVSEIGKKILTRGK